MSDHFTNARLVARRCVRSGDRFDCTERLGTADAWYFGTPGHGYYAAHVPGMSAALATVLNSNEWLEVDLDTEIVAGEEDCAAAVVLWVASMRGANLPDAIKVTELYETAERHFPGLIDRIGAALAA